MALFGIDKSDVELELTNLKPPIKHHLVADLRLLLTNN